MADPARELESKLLELGPRDRARLAEKLIASLEGTADPESEAEWLAESERRLAEIESGQAAGVSSQQVFQKSRSSLR